MKVKKTKSEKETVNTQPTASVLVVPVTRPTATKSQSQSQEETQSTDQSTDQSTAPPPPAKLERQPSVKTKANKKGPVKVEEALNEMVEEADETDEYEKAVKGTSSAASARTT